MKWKEVLFVGHSLLQLWPKSQAQVIEKEKEATQQECIHESVKDESDQV